MRKQANRKLKKEIIKPVTKSAGIEPRDILANLVTETVTEKEKAFLTSVLDQMPVGVLMIDAASERILLRNKKFDEMTQMPAITFFHEHKNFFDATRKDGSVYAPDEYPIVRTVKYNETIIDEDVIYRHKGGRQQTYSVNAAPIHDRNGKIIAGVALYGDITARARAATDVEFLLEAGVILSSSLDKQVILQNIAELIVANIAEGCSIDLIDISGVAGLAAVRYKDRKILKEVYELRKKGYLTHPNIGAGAVLRTGRSVLYHQLQPAAMAQLVGDKEYADLLVRSGFTSAMIAPLRIKEKILGAISCTSSNSEKLFDSSHLKLLEALAERVSLKLENIQLYTNAREAIELRDDFITMASHELKTPLATTLMGSHLLETALNAGNVREASSQLKEMNAELWELSNLINLMLDLSRIQGGKFTYKKKIVDINKLLGEICERDQKMAPDHRIIWKPGSGAVDVYGDSERIGQVLSNLIINAVKFSPPSDILVTSEIKGSTIRVSVKDFGVGIPKDQVKKIFERFHQITPVEQKLPGLGVGLHIASEIVKNHGGTIWCDSEPGKGSTFSFSLPIIVKESEH